MMTIKEYKEQLQENVQKLHNELRKGKVLIPKEDIK